MGKIAAQAARGVEGVQLSALSHKAALPPLVSFGLSPDQHFERSMEIARRILPTEESVKVDEDLKFAVAMMVDSRSELGRLRDEALKAVRLPRHGWRPVSETEEGSARGH